MLTIRKFKKNEKCATQHSLLDALEPGETENVGLAHEIIDVVYSSKAPHSSSVLYPTLCKQYNNKVLYNNTFEIDV